MATQASTAAGISKAGRGRGQQAGGGAGQAGKVLPGSGGAGSGGGASSAKSVGSYAAAVGKPVTVDTEVAKETAVAMEVEAAVSPSAEYTEQVRTGAVGLTGFGGLPIKHVSGVLYPASSGVFKRKPLALASLSMPQTRICLLGVISGGATRAFNYHDDPAEQKAIEAKGLRPAGRYSCIFSDVKGGYSVLEFSGGPYNSTPFAAEFASDLKKIPRNRVVVLANVDLVATIKKIQAGKALVLKWNPDTSAIFTAALDVPDDSSNYVTLAAARDGPEGLVNVRLVFQGIYARNGKNNERSRNVAMLVSDSTAVMSVKLWGENADVMDWDKLVPHESKLAMRNLFNNRREKALISSDYGVEVTDITSTPIAASIREAVGDVGGYNCTLQEARDEKGDSVKMVRATLTEINESVSTLCWNGSCKRHDTIALCYYDDNDNELPEPLYECTVCHAKRSEAPSRMGKLQLMLRQMGVYLETYAGNQLVPRIAKLPVEEWGEDAGSAQRLALRNMFGNWVGQEYRVIMAAVQNRMYVNELQPLASKQGCAVVQKGQAAGGLARALENTLNILSNTSELPRDVTLTVPELLHPKLRGGVGMASLPSFMSKSGQRFEVQNVVGDGRCLFRAMAFHLFGCEDRYQDVIDGCVAYVIGMWSVYGIYAKVCHEGFGNVNTVQEYQSYMQHGYAFGTSTEVIGIAGAFACHISVYDSSGQIVLHTGAFVNAGQQLKTCCVVKTGDDQSGHYAALVDTAVNIVCAPEQSSTIVNLQERSHSGTDSHMDSEDIAEVLSRERLEILDCEEELSISDPMEHEQSNWQPLISSIGKVLQLNEADVAVLYKTQHDFRYREPETGFQEVPVYMTEKMPHTERAREEERRLQILTCQLGLDVQLHSACHAVERFHPRTAVFGRQHLLTISSSCAKQAPLDDGKRHDRSSHIVKMQATRVQSPTLHAYANLSINENDAAINQAALDIAIKQHRILELDEGRYAVKLKLNGMLCLLGTYSNIQEAVNVHDSAMIVSYQRRRMVKEAPHAYAKNDTKLQLPANVITSLHTAMKGSGFHVKHFHVIHPADLEIILTTVNSNPAKLKDSNAASSACVGFSQLPKTTIAPPFFADSLVRSMFYIVHSRLPMFCEDRMGNCAKRAIAVLRPIRSSPIESHMTRAEIAKWLSLVLQIFADRMNLSIHVFTTDGQTWSEPGVAEMPIASTKSQTLSTYELRESGTLCGPCEPVYLLCHDAFAGKFEPLVPVQASARVAMLNVRQAVRGSKAVNAEKRKSTSWADESPAIKSRRIIAETSEHDQVVPDCGSMAGIGSSLDNSRPEGMGDEVQAEAELGSCANAQAALGPSSNVGSHNSGKDGKEAKTRQTRQKLSHADVAVMLTRKKVPVTLQPDDCTFKNLEMPTSLYRQHAAELQLPCLVSNRLVHAIWTDTGSVLVARKQGVQYQSIVDAVMAASHVELPHSLEHNLQDIADAASTAITLWQAHSRVRVASMTIGHAYQDKSHLHLYIQNNCYFILQSVPLVTDTEITTDRLLTITRVQVGRKAIDYADSMPTKLAGRCRDITTILLSKKRSRLNFPLQCYFSEQKCFSMPIQVKAAIEHLPRPHCKQIRNSKFLFPAGSHMVFQSMPVVKDHFHFVRSVAQIVYGAEAHFPVVIQRVVHFVNKHDQLCSELLESIRGQMAVYPAWDAAVVVGNSQEEYHKYMSLPDEMELNRFEVAVVAMALQRNICVYDGTATKLLEVAAMLNDIEITVPMVQDAVNILHHQTTDYLCNPLVEVTCDQIEEEMQIDIDASGQCQEHSNEQALPHDLMGELEYIQSSMAVPDKEMGHLLKFVEAKHDLLTNVCFSCHRLFFSHQGRFATTLRRSFDASYPAIASQNHIASTWCCNSCQNSFRCNNINAYCIAHGYTMNSVPTALTGLKALEERLIAASTPFMQLRSRHMYRSSDHPVCKFPVISVPNDINRVLHELPVTTNIETTICVRFMRQLCYKSAYRTEIVSPSVVLTALQWLFEHAPLWASWARKSAAIMHTIRDTINANETQHTNEDDMDVAHADTDMGTNVNEENMQLQAEQHTAVQARDAQDLLQAQERVLHLAPSSNMKPVSIFSTPHIEEQSYPCLFGGQPRQWPQIDGIDMPYARIVNWELLHHDRRFARNIENLFFKLFKLRVEAVSKEAAFKVRQHKDAIVMNRTQALDGEFLKSMTTADSAYVNFQQIRGSPGYFQSLRREAFAMLRQLGKPAWFFTLSAADTRWIELLRMLELSRTGNMPTVDEAQAWTFAKRSELIREDPVTCVRYYHHRIMAFIKHVLEGADTVLGGLDDWWLRHEAQQRGVMHGHAIGYTSKAPMFDAEDATSWDAVTEYIDKHVTCSRTAVPWELLQVQVHSHNPSCKKAHNGCRAYFPRPPMPKTTILMPLDIKNLSDTEQEQLQNAYCQITCGLSEIYAEMKGHRDNWRPHCSIPDFATFLQKLGMSESTYYRALSFKLKQAKVFLRRMPHEVLINNYSIIGLTLWRANMDVQYILDPYAAASYTTTYMTKADKGISIAMQRLTEELRKRPNIDTQQLVRELGNAFINAQEVCAQEAAYLTTGLPLKVSTRDTVYINTKRSCERQHTLKNKADLEQLPEDSTDVMKTSLIDHYAKRPASMEDICLADFVAWYNPSKVKTVDVHSNPLLTVDGEAAEHTAPANHSTQDNALPRHCGSYKRSTYAKILRYHLPEKHAWPTEHMRVMMLLFAPWRNEAIDLEGDPADVRERYWEDTRQALMQANHSRYNQQADIETLAKQAEQDALDTEREEQEISRGPNQVQQLEATHLYDTSTFAHVPADDVTYDIGDDIVQAESASRNVVVDTLQNHLIPLSTLNAMIRSLNIEQSNMLYHILRQVREGQQPFHIFISGGAGVGKSHLLTAIEQSVKRWYLRQPGKDYEKTPVVVLAPTGTAAFNVRGMTIHSALGIPPNRDLSDFAPLYPDRANSLRAAWTEVRLLICDEVSMCGNRMLHIINLRLQQILQCSLPFGGLSSTSFGDLLQLRPVMDGWIFDLLVEKLLALSPGTWQHFKLYELHQVMRQRNTTLIERLNRLRVNALTADDLAWFQSRTITRNSPEYNPVLPHIFPTNKAVNAHNAAFLSTLPGDVKVLHALDTLSQPLPTTQTASILAKANKLPSSRTGGLALAIELKLNAPVELTINVDVSDGLTNGATGRICNWGLTDTGEVAVLYIAFTNPESGLKARTTYNTVNRRLGALPQWTPVYRSMTRFGFSRISTMQIQRLQFPVRLCAARTIHRVQGQSLPALVIDLSGRCEPGLHYVAISRVTNPENLWFLNFNPSRISCNQSVLREYARLREHSTMQLAMPALLNLPSTAFAVTVFNCRSLHGNIDNLAAHGDLLRSDVLICTETWAIPADPDSHYHINTYTMLRSDNCTAQFESRPHRGIIMYFRHCTLTHIICAHHTGSDIVGVQCQTPAITLNIIGIYKSPQMPMLAFLAELQTVIAALPAANPLLILGDFNVDIRQASPQSVFGLAYEAPDHHLRALVAFMLSRQLSQHLDGPTIDSGLQIDHIWTDVYTRLAHMHPCTYRLESVCSDHRPVGIYLTPESR